MTHPDAARLAFALGPGFSPPRHADDLRATLTRLWPQRERWIAWRSHTDLPALLRTTSAQLSTLDQLGAKALFCDDPTFPSSLLRAPSPPAVVFVQGAPGLLKESAQSVAIVGSRAAYRRELDFATALGADASSRGQTVVSGGAIGIDAAAHRGALEVGGKTAVILGSGLDKLYPPRNRRLFTRVTTANGLLLTPFAPGTPPRRGNFPARNALVAAASELVVVVAAAARSGALSTARQAIKLGVPVAALPGTPGCDGLLAKGQARTLREIDDLAALLANEETSAAEPLSESAHELITALAEYGQSPAELSMLLRRPLAEITSMLLELELDGRVVRGPGGAYRPLC